MTGYCLLLPLNMDFVFETALRAHGKLMTANLLATKVIPWVSEPK